MILVALCGLGAFALVRGPVWFERFQAYRAHRPILQRLNRVIPADTKPPATLVEALELVQAVTADEGMPGGVPIYLDPIGLLEVNTYPGAPVEIRLQGMTARDLLSDSLRPLGLDYQIRDRLITVTSHASLDVDHESFR